LDVGKVALSRQHFVLGSDLLLAFEEHEERKNVEGKQLMYSNGTKKLPFKYSTYFSSDGYNIELHLH
jgi:hypothetical protein